MSYGGPEPLTSAEKRELLRDLLKRSGPVPRQLSRESYLLSSAQLRMWFLHQLEPESGRYHVLHAVRLDGPFNPAAFRWALNQSVRRHDALRTIFRVEDGQPVQVIAPELPLELTIADVRNIETSQRDARAREILHAECARPFDLERGPVIRAGVIRLEDQTHFLYVAMHHIVSDGRSLDTVLRELIVLAGAYEDGNPPDLPTLTHQYRDYAVWQREQVESVAVRHQIDRWQKSLSGAPPLLRLPWDRPRPERLSDRGARLPFSIEDGVARRFRDLCAAENVTLYAGLLAAFQTLLARYSGEESVVTGFPVANRMRPEWEHKSDCSPTPLRSRPP